MKLWAKINIRRKTKPNYNARGGSSLLLNNLVNNGFHWRNFQLISQCSKLSVKPFYSFSWNNNNDFKNLTMNWCFWKEIVRFVNVEADLRLQDLLHLQNNPHEEAREKPILAICFEKAKRCPQTQASCRCSFPSHWLYCIKTHNEPHNLTCN